MIEWFNATNVLQYYRMHNPDKPKRRMKDFWENSYVQEFISELEAKGINEAYRTRRGRGGYTEMRYEIFPLFLEWIAPNLLSDYKNKYPQEYDEYLNMKRNSVTTTYKKKEKDFEAVLDSLVYSQNTSLYKQYIIGSRFIDFVVHHRNKDFGDSYILIEFDEDYHNSENQRKKDAKREKELSEYFKKQKEVSYACIIRVPYDKVGIAYTYLIPYITGIETSMCSDKIQQLLYYKCLYSED